VDRIDVNKFARSGAFRWGIIGLGNVGTAHMAAIIENGDELAGFSSRNALTRSGDTRPIKFNMDPTLGCLFRTSGMVVKDDYRELLASDQFDGFIVCVPPAMHLEVGLNVAKSGKHCFMEKPMALSAFETEKLAAAFGKAAGKLVVGHVLPAIPPFEFLLAKLRVEGLAKVSVLEMTRHVRASRLENRDDTITRGGFVWDLGAHDVQLLTLLGNPESVSALEVHEMYDQPQHLVFALQFSNSEGLFKLDVGAHKSCAEFTHAYRLRMNNGSTLMYDGKDVIWNGRVVEVETRTVSQMFAHELKIAVEYFRGKRPDPDFLCAIAAHKTIKTLEAAAVSAKSNTPVSLV
jgi:predicted dehydrogenase